MKYLFYLFLGILFIPVLNSNLISQENQLPKVEKRITDNAGVLTSTEINYLTEKLDKYKSAAVADLIIVTIPTLNSEEIREYGIRLLEKIKAGSEEKNNGVLLLIAIQDKKISIEVGYGLEGELTDAQSSFIIRNIITPKFKVGNYFQGVDEGTTAILNTISGIELSNQSSETTDIPYWVGLLGFVFFIFLRNTLSNRPNNIGSKKHGYPYLIGGFGGGFGGRSSGWSGGGGSFGGGGASGSW